MKKLTVVVGGQYGSEGKGNVAGELHKRDHYDWGVRVGGPNAGHTVVDAAGVVYPLRQIPVAAAVDPDCKLFIAAGSEIDPDVLKREISLLEANGHEVANRLFLHPEATVIRGTDRDAESDMPHGSTQKGIGAARAARALRTARVARDVITGLPTLSGGTLAYECSVLIEGTQGYGLGSHAGHYPHCTSGDCRAIDFMAQAGVGPFVDELDVWVVLRTYPIRIAGNSGPLENEVDWESIGVKPEYTTVTKKIRRVGLWDTELAQAAILANGGAKAKVALTFADYWWPDMKGAVSLGDLPFDRAEQIMGILRELQDDLGAPIELIGTGPSTFIHLTKET